MRTYILSIDLGKESDHTALSLIELQQRLREAPPRHRYDTEPPYIMSVFALIGLHRMEVGAAYHEIAERAARIVNSPAYKQNIITVIDATGVGNAVCEIFEHAGVSPLRIVITSGHDAKVVDGSYHVPKKDLIDALRIAFGTGRIRVAPGLQDWPTLLGELQNFVMKRNTKTGHESFEAWRERDHDDLVLSLAMGVWTAYEIEGFGEDKEIPTDGEKLEWNPYETI